jgi:hypothetical protein
MYVVAIRAYRWINSMDIVCANFPYDRRVDAIFTTNILEPNLPCGDPVRAKLYRGSEVRGVKPHHRDVKQNLKGVQF